MTYTWFPHPHELALWITERRDTYARHQYQDAQMARWRRNEPLLPEFDTMTEEERTSAALYAGHDVTVKPDEVSPVTWEHGLAEYRQMTGPPRTPTPAETKRGYDIHGNPC